MKVLTVLFLVAVFFASCIKEKEIDISMYPRPPEPIPIPAIVPDSVKIRASEFLKLTKSIYYIHFYEDTTKGYYITEYNRVDSIPVPLIPSGTADYKVNVLQGIYSDAEAYIFHGHPLAYNCSGSGFRVIFKNGLLYFFDM